LLSPGFADKDYVKSDPMGVVGQGRIGMPTRGGIVHWVASVSLVLLAALGILVGCGSGGGQEEEEGAQEEEVGGAPLLTGSFVGETTQDPNMLVAIIADEPEQGDDQREVRAYLCDARTINEWFRGTITGNDLDLISEDETAELKGSLRSGAATGTFTLGDGRSFSFEASPATDIAGLYDISISADERTAQGTSETGARLEGQLSPQAEDGRYPVTGTITPTDGSSQEFQASAGSLLLEPGSECRVIYSSDGRSSGVRKGERSTGYIDPTTWL
jgi:hypothetical protein